MQETDAAGQVTPGSADQTPAADTAGAGDPAGALGGTLAALASLDDEPLDGHPEVYQRIHGELSAALTGIDDA